MINKNKLKWKCRRGVLELDTVLSEFYQHHIDELSQVELQEFEALLTIEDPFLLDWLIYGKKVPLEHSNIINKILNRVVDL